MKKITWVIAIIAVAAIIYLISVLDLGRSKSKKLERDTYTSAPFTYKVMPIEKLGMAAKFIDKEVTYDDLTTRSPVLRDLLLTKYKVLATAASQKISTLPKSTRKHKVILYMEAPEKNLNVSGRDQNFSLEFSNERPKNAVMKIDDQLFGRDKLELNQLFYSLNETKIFNERLRATSELFKNQFLLQLSKEKNMTIQAFINKVILKLPVQPVTNQEVAEFAKSRGIPLDEKDASMTERLRSIISERKTQSSIDEYISSNHPSSPGLIYFSPPDFNIPIDDKVGIFSDGKTEKTAPALVVYAKLRCGGCGDLAQQLDEIRNKYKNKIRVGFVHLYSEGEWKDQMAAQASLCLADQSNDAFWQFFTKLSQSKEDVSEDFIKTTVKSIPVDQEAFQKCFIAQTHKEKLQEQLSYATKLGISVSPTFIFGAQVLSGQILEEHLNTAIHAGIAD